MSYVKRRKQVLALFQRYDQNSNGTIEPDELATLLQHVDPATWSDDKVGRLFREIDSNQNGLIEYKEFVDWAFGKIKPGSDWAEGSSADVVHEAVRLGPDPAVITAAAGGAARREEWAAKREAAAMKGGEERGADENGVELCVAGPGGHLCTISVETSSTVREVKDLIEASASIPVARQRLFHGTQELTGGALAGFLPPGTHSEELLLVQPGLSEQQIRWLEELEDSVKAEKVKPDAHNGAAYWLRDNPEAQQDRVMVLAAMHMSKESTIGHCMHWAADDIKADRDFVLSAVDHSWRNLECAAAELKADRDVVLAAIAQSGYALRFASAGLQADRDVVLAAVKKDGGGFQYAAADLKADREVVMAAYDGGAPALVWAPEELRADKEFVLTLIARCRGAYALQHAASDLQADRDVVLAAVMKSGYVLQYAAADLQADRDLILTAIPRWAEAFTLAPADLQANRDFVISAVGLNSATIQYVSEDLAEDPDVLQSFRRAHASGAHDMGMSRPAPRRAKAR